MTFSYRMLEGEIAYTGAELHGGFVRDRAALDGDAAVAFFGPCHVPTENLVDLDDARAGTFIRAAAMAHVIVEHPACALATAVLRQRLLVAILGEVLASMGKLVRREGDDLYYGDRKLTVSIAAPASSSCVIHLGVNVDPAGAPVPAVGLTALGLDPHAVIDRTLSRYGAELESAAYAATKVRTVP